MSRPADDLVAMAYKTANLKVIGPPLVFYDLADIATYCATRRAVRFMAVPIYRGRPLARKSVTGVELADYVREARAQAQAEAQAKAQAQATAPAAVCSCPSGGGGLVWPCRVHPAQAVKP